MIRQSRNPDSAHQQKIDRHDERNIKIREKSAFNAFFVTMLALVAAFVVFLVMDIWSAAMIMTSVMALHVGSFLVFMYVNDKKM